MVRGRSETTFAQRGGGGGQLGAILCKLFRLEVYIKRGGGGQKSRKYANVVYVRPRNEIQTLLDFKNTLQRPL